MKKPMKPTGSGFAAFKAKAKGAQEPDVDDAKGGGLAGYLKKKAAKK
jgi:hypothetical protein